MSKNTLVSVCVLLATLLGFTSGVYAAAPDFSTLITAVDFSTVITGITAVGALVAAVYVVKRGIGMILGAIAGR